MCNLEYSMIDHFYRSSEEILWLSVGRLTFFSEDEIVDMVKDDHV